jgi:hypothetical protein
MCDLGKAITRIFTPPGTGGAEAAQIQQQADLQNQQAQLSQATQKSSQAVADALAQQTAAIKESRKAALPVSDSASARAAAEDRLRKLFSGAAFSRVSGQQFFGEPPTGYRMLTGM